MMYYLIIALQIYCLYHAYTNRREWYWYLVIFLIPVIGCAIYLITQVFKKRDLDKVQKEVVTVLNPTKRVKDLEKKLAFSDTFQSRINLADAYLDMKDLTNAIEQYRAALKGSHADYFYGNANLVEALYLDEQYDEAILVAQGIEDHSDFDKSKSNLYYGQAIFQTGDVEKAAQILKKINRRYSNYPERLMLALFLKDNGKEVDAIELVEELMDEGRHHAQPSKRKYKMVFADIEKLQKELAS